MKNMPAEINSNKSMTPMRSDVQIITDL
jgi:hypothetical protein